MISSVKKIKNFHMLPPIQDEILWRAPKVKEMKFILMLPLVYKEFFNILLYMGKCVNVRKFGGVDRTPV